jgi:hypothetical protein
MLNKSNVFDKIVKTLETFLVFQVSFIHLHHGKGNANGRTYT